MSIGTNEIREYFTRISNLILRLVFEREREREREGEKQQFSVGHISIVGHAAAVNRRASRRGRRPSDADSRALARQASWRHLLHSGLAWCKPGQTNQACSRQAKSAIDGSRGLVWPEPRTLLAIVACEGGGEHMRQKSSSSPCHCAVALGHRDVTQFLLQDE